jgi:hypothetical protein
MGRLTVITAKNRSLQSSFWLVWLVSLLLFVTCKEPFEQPVSKGDDGQLFAIDTEQSELPYLVIDTRGAEIPYEPGVLATMKIYYRCIRIDARELDLGYFLSRYTSTDDCQHSTAHSIRTESCHYLGTCS